MQEIYINNVQLSFSDRETTRGHKTYIMPQK